MPKKTKKAKTHATLQRKKQTLSVPDGQQSHALSQPVDTLHYSLSLPTHTQHETPMSRVDADLFAATKQDIRTTIMLASIALVTLLILSTILH